MSSLKVEAILGHYGLLEHGTSLGGIRIQRKYEEQARHQLLFKGCERNAASNQRLISTMSCSCIVDYGLGAMCFIFDLQFRGWLLPLGN